MTKRSKQADYVGPSSLSSSSSAAAYKRKRCKIVDRDTTTPASTPHVAACLSDHSKDVISNILMNRDHLFSLLGIPPPASLNLYQPHSQDDMGPERTKRREKCHHGPSLRFEPHLFAVQQPNAVLGDNHLTSMFQLDTPAAVEISKYESAPREEINRVTLPLVVAGNKENHNTNGNLDGSTVFDFGNTKHASLPSLSGDSEATTGSLILATLKDTVFSIIAKEIKTCIEVCNQHHQHLGRPSARKEVLEAMNRLLYMMCCTTGKGQRIVIDLFVNGAGVHMLEQYLCWVDGGDKEKNNSEKFASKDILLVGWALLQAVCQHNSAVIWDTMPQGTTAVKGLVRSFAHCTSHEAAQKALKHIDHEDLKAASTLQYGPSLVQLDYSISQVLNPCQETRERFMYTWIEGLFQYLMGEDKEPTHEEARQGLDFLYWIYTSSPAGKHAVKMLQPARFRVWLQEYSWRGSAFEFYLSEFMRPFDWVFVEQK